MADKGVIVKVKGPTKLHIFFRAFMKDRRKVRAKLKVYAGNRLVKSAIKTLKPSRKAVFLVGEDRITASVPLKLSLKVPKGLHRYRIVVSGAEGAVKPYMEKVKRKKRRGGLFRFTDMGMAEYGPMLASLNAVDYKEAKVKKRKKRRKKTKARKRRKRRRRFKHHYVRVSPAISYARLLPHLPLPFQEESLHRPFAILLPLQVRPEPAAQPQPLQVIP